jgi:positive regulator of sigma E activity
MKILTIIEKSPLQSKKFVAYFISNIGSKLLMAWMVTKQASSTTMVAAIIAAAFIDIGYILGQAALDRYVRVMAIRGKPPTGEKESE